MKKSMQLQINRDVEQYLEVFNRRSLTLYNTEKLRSCSATVETYVDDLTGEVLHVLRSYNTIVAIIDGSYAYDFLRLVYGYTATSAQHIAKFFSDYLWGYRSDLTEFTWRSV